MVRGKKETNIEPLIAENAKEALTLRLRRMTSATVCRRMLTAKHPDLSIEIVAQKAEGVASALRSALGYWESRPVALNAKILSLYYFALQLSIAEEVSNADPGSTLVSIQKHTEQGHGLGTVRPPETSFPERYYIAALKSGHFSAYCKSTGIDLTDIAFEGKPRSWSKVKEEDKAKLVSLSDLLRRIPELRPLLAECLGAPPLSFHLVHSAKNMEMNAAAQMASYEAQARGTPQPAASSATTTTYVTFASGFEKSIGVTPEYIASLGFPIEEIQSEIDPISGRPEIFGKLEHPTGEHWFESLPLYHSHIGTSLLVPVWGRVSDIFVIHFMTLYALSIVVRYLPSLWFEIENGLLDNIKALLEHYVTVADIVVPKCGIERIAGTELRLIYPGSLTAPI